MPVMTSTRATWRTCCTLFILGAFGLAPLRAQQAPVGVCDAAVQEAPLDYTLKDLAGNAVSLASYKAHVIVLNFWATWCGPCRIEIPRLIKLQDQYKTKGLIVVGLSMDTDVEKVPAYAQRVGINYPIFTIGRDHALQKAYAPMWGVPSTVLIRRNGLICRRQLAFVSDRDFENRIQALLREAQ